MNNVVHIKGSREAPKNARSTMETVIISIDQVNQWRIPSFQRPVRVNAKVEAIAEEMKNGVEIAGVITLGKIEKEQILYIVDGQHRIEAFRISGMSEIIADLRIVQFQNMAEMSDEFVRLNSALVRMRPDDILRGLEASTPFLAKIRKECPFVGYDNIRRSSSSSPVLGMSQVVRNWAGSSTETPSPNLPGGGSVASAALHIDANSVDDLIRFLNIAHQAWGRDPEYFRLWGQLNLTVCMWLWRRLVTNVSRSGTTRYIAVTAPQFKQCLMALSANHDYLDWLPGRNLSDRDRSPCYVRIKNIFTRRLSEEMRDKRKILLPLPPWASR